MAAAEAWACPCPPDHALCLNSGRGFVSATIRATAESAAPLAQACRRARAPIGAAGHKEGQGRANPPMRAGAGSEGEDGAGEVRGPSLRRPAFDRPVCGSMDSTGAAAARPLRTLCPALRAPDRPNSGALGAIPIPLAKGSGARPRRSAREECAASRQTRDHHNAGILAGIPKARQNLLNHPRGRPVFSAGWQCCAPLAV